MAACPFCAIAAGQAPAQVLAQTPRALAFLDIRQAVPGHVLVVPRRHVQDIFDMPAELAAEVMALAVRVAQALERHLQCPGLTLWQSNGAAGGQEVPHFHLHVHPRLPGDTRLWAALQDASGGTWGGCVYDVDTILETLRTGREALAARERSA